MSNRSKLRQPQPTSFLRRQPGAPDTRWNGQPCTAVPVLVAVADAPEFPQYWARDLIGTTRFAVRVTYGERTFYLDDEDGSGWYKVTHGGGPGHPSRSLSVEREVLRQAVSPAQIDTP